MSLEEVEAECPGALGILAGGMKRSVAMEEEDVVCMNVPMSNEVCIGLYINSSLEFLGGRKRPPCPFRTARKPCRSRFGFVGPMILVALLGRLVRVFSVLGLNCHHRAAHTPHRHEVYHAKLLTLTDNRGIPQDPCTGMNTTAQPFNKCMPLRCNSAGHTSSVVL